MPKASEVASELRKLADSLDREPDAEIPVPVTMFHCYERQRFTETVRLMPHPLTKSVFMPESQWPDMHVIHDNPSIRIIASAPRSVACRIIKPAQEAVYECDTLLSDEEEATLETAVAE